MNSSPTILIVKESRHGEQRVSLLPREVEKLTKEGFNILVEDQAGMGSGFDNSDYESVGAKISNLESLADVKSYSTFFENTDIIVRVKRPDRAREKLENLAIKPRTKMIGSLDLLEKNSNHVREYHKAGIDYYSFDQFYYPPNTPMDALKKMGSFAGKLAIKDAIKKLNRVAERVVIIGYGMAGQAAYAECLKRKLACTVITSQQDKVRLIKSRCDAGVEFLSRDLPLLTRQDNIKHHIKAADIVITSASSNGSIAPILIPNESLFAMKQGSVIVDLSVPEGGNVEGSRADATLVLGNHICVTNVSGYPKAIPVEASELWSKASYYFLHLLLNASDLLKLR